MRITSRMPRAEYDGIAALNISRLKEMKRSPQHYFHALTNRAEKACLDLGNATHVAVLEPDRYANTFATWTRRTEGGNAAPRNGKHWEAFQLENPGKTILTYDQNAAAVAIAEAVRGHSKASTYLANGDPEVTLEWSLDPALGSRPAKSRVDWLTVLDGDHYLVGLKTARNCAHFAFGRQAAQLEYAMQWAFYFDAYKAITGRDPKMREIVVEVDAPHAVAVYRITEDIVVQGRENYWELAKQLAECEERNEWPGPVLDEEDLTLPTWYYGKGDDIGDLELAA